MTTLLQSDTLKGIALLLLATVLFALQDAITKQLVTNIHVTQILFVRFLAFAIFAVVYASVKTQLTQSLRSANRGLQISRALIMFTEIGLFAFAIKFLGIAEIHAIFSCFPLVITALSVPLLGETVGWRRWLAVGIGFCGTLIILQPGSGVFNPAALLALVCVMLYSFYNILTRLVSRQDTFETSLLYFGIVGLAASSIAVIGNWQSTDGPTSLLLAGIVVTSVAAHMMLIKSLELAAAVVLQPFNYFILVWAVLLGYVLFNETLAPHEIVGALIVVGSGVYIGIREYRLAMDAS